MFDVCSTWGARGALHQPAAAGESQPHTPHPTVGTGRAPELCLDPAVALRFIFTYSKSFTRCLCAAASFGGVTRGAPKALSVNLPLCVGLWGCTELSPAPLGADYASILIYALPEISRRLLKECRAELTLSAWLCAPSLPLEQSQEPGGQQHLQAAKLCCWVSVCPWHGAGCSGRAAQPAPPHPNPPRGASQDHSSTNSLPAQQPPHS